MNYQGSGNIGKMNDTPYSAEGFNQPSPAGYLGDLENIITDRGLYPVYQPIFQFNNPVILGYEALIRGPADSPLHTPLMLFETANRNRMLVPLEYLCIDLACEKFQYLNLEGKLFVNISPVSLLQPDYITSITEQIMGKHGITAEKIVIEISEQYPLDNYELIRKALVRFRDDGFEIAIDDLGAGFSNLRIWSELMPDYVKIDRHFIENINDNPVKCNFVRSIREISQSLGCKVIAEGIETEEELSTLRDFGINIGQGYYLGLPQALPDSTISGHLNNIKNSGGGMPIINRMLGMASDMVDYSISLTPEVSIGDAADIFMENPGLYSIPVIDNDVPVGSIIRKTVLELFLGRYGRDLYAKKPIRKFMNSSPVIVEYNCTLDEVSRLITNNPELDLSLDFIITKLGRYLGVGKIKKLLKKITEQQIASARYSNPLTLLPGNVPVHEWIDNSLKMKVDFCVAYCDLNYFKPYNDVYGYSRGDEVIVRFGDLLKKNVVNVNDHIGHIGGDDFIIIFTSKDWQECCERIIEQFEKALPGFYSSKAIEEGGIWSINRRGEKEFMPLLSLAIGVAKPDPSRCLSHHDVSTLVADAKHEAKKIGGNALFISRRRSPIGSLPYPAGTANQQYQPAVDHHPVSLLFNSG